MMHHFLVCLQLRVGVRVLRDHSFPSLIHFLAHPLLYISSSRLIPLATLLGSVEKQ